MVLSLAAIPAGAMQDSVEQSRQYVERLDKQCVFDHGYVCRAMPGDNFGAPGRDRDMIPGAYLKAWSVSYQDFLRIPEMTDKQKQLKHYKVGFAENATQFIILYQGLLLPMLENGKVVGAMRATYGLTTQYWIDKATLAIDKRLFLR